MHGGGLPVKVPVLFNSATAAKEGPGYPAEVYPYTAGIVGGLLGGAVMVIPALIYGLLSGYGPWLPVNLIAATVIRGIQGMTREQAAAFDPIALVVGLTIHLIMATALGLLFAMLLPTLPGRPQIWALIIGPLLWFGATIIVLPQVNPAMTRFLDWPSFGLGNIAYGLIMGFWVEQTQRVPAHTQDFLLRFYWPSFFEK
jgi:uncharacterized protein DUF6789